MFQFIKKILDGITARLGGNDRYPISLELAISPLRW